MSTTNMANMAEKCQQIAKTMQHFSFSCLSKFDFGIENLWNIFRCRSRIWSRGGPQLLRPKVADVVKRSRASEVSNLQLGVQGPLKGPGSFWVFNAQICILTHSRDSFSLIFDIYFDTKS